VRQGYPQRVFVAFFFNLGVYAMNNHDTACDFFIDGVNGVEGLTASGGVVSQLGQ
jgi:hypothetical protein